jgi:maleate isomerase
VTQLSPVPPGIGIVAPFDLALDRELWRWVPEPVSLYVTRTPALDTAAVSVSMVEALGDEAALTAACREVAVPQPGVVAYLCTSGSFVGGLAGEARLRAAMERGGARHAITTSGALLDALRTLDARRVAIATPYDAELTGLLASFLGEAGFAVTGTGHLGLGEDIWRVEPEAVLELARAVPREGADALFLSCTNLPTFDVLPILEAELGLPVLSANQVTLNAALHVLRGLSP